ncbi:hypothetical protein [Synechococcus sp. M16CYN]|uniref:hypothetical protein n=1 Tax=Synechococcus sp. M16CYN TaxID=3103139 RepID=UPI0032443853
MSLILARSETASGKRQDHESAARDLFDRARQCAEAGQISDAGSLILQALSHERRASAVGPQVIQLIKPRS